MIQWLKNALGIRRYTVAWHITYPSGAVLTGNYVGKYGLPPHSRGSAQRIADDMNQIYGENTHWIEAI